MKPVNIIGDYFAFGVPDKAYDFRIDTSGELLMKVPGSLLLSDEYEIEGWQRGKWSIVSTSDEMTEAIAQKIVERDGEFYEDYDYSPARAFWRTALHSFQSLLKSHGLEGRQLILKKEL